MSQCYPRQIFGCHSFDHRQRGGKQDEHVPADHMLRSIDRYLHLMSTDGWNNQFLRRGLTGGLAVMGAQLSELKQSVMGAIWWLHGPYPKEAA